MWRYLWVAVVLCACPLAAEPVAGGVVNAASSILPGRPNASLTPGGLFSLFGTEMGPAQLVQAQEFPLPLELAGTSVRVTVAGVTADCIVLFTSAGQIAAILPSNTPIGEGMMTVSFQGQTSAPLSIRVAAGNFGIFSLSQRGEGRGVFTDPLATRLRLNGSFEAARPGEVWDIWGTGLGPVTADEAAAPAPGDLTNIDVKALVGGREAQVLYRGRSGCCAGVDQVRFVVPEGVESCHAPVVVVVDGVPSNFVTMAVSRNGSTCSSPGRDAAENLELFESTGYLRQGQLLLARVWTTTQAADGSASTQRADSAAAAFVELRYDRILDLPPDRLPPGSCLVSPLPASSPEVRGLEAGRLNVNASTGAAELTRNSPGFYTLSFAPPAGVEAGRGYSFSTPGGELVGPFQASITPSEPIELMNPEQLRQVDRSAGLPIRWSRGRGLVVIRGTSPFAVGPEGPVGAQFVCYADPAAGAFEIPPEVLRSLPASVDDDGAPAGSITVGQLVDAGGFQAQGLDLGQLLVSDLYVTNTRFR
jgi:uncharacterized protein (TIGR03437 family)